MYHKHILLFLTYVRIGDINFVYVMLGERQVLYKFYKVIKAVSRYRSLRSVSVLSVRSSGYFNMFNETCIYYCVQF